MEPMGRPSKYSPELRERAVRMVQDHAPEYPSQWVAIRSVAEKLGCSIEALRRWVRQAERDGGQRPGLTTDERQRLKQLERENFELRRANEILKKASVNSTVRRNDVSQFISRRVVTKRQPRTRIQLLRDRIELSLCVV